MTGGVRTWIAVLALAGLAASVSSTYVHFQLVADPGYTSFCDINESVSCTQLYESQYGSVAGVPVALGGVFWFGAVLFLIWADAKGPSRSRENVAAYLLVWSTVGLSVAMYMAYASFFALQTFCILCGVVYVTVIGIFLLTGSGASTPLRQLPGAMLKDIAQLVRRPVGLVMTLSFVAAMMAAVVWFPESQPLLALAEPTGDTVRPQESADQQSEFERYWSEQPRVDPAISGVEAAVVVLKFNDYQCPACADTHRAYDPIFAKYETSFPGAVRLVMRDFPLDSECNEGSPNGLHDSACEAAVAARLAAEVGTTEGRRMGEWLYANQAEMSPDTISAALADIAGLDAGVFEARYDEVIEDVKADIAIGLALPVEATPTFVVNGVLLKGGLPPQFFDQAIALELERATATP